MDDKDPEKKKGLAASVSSLAQAFFIFFIAFVAMLSHSEHGRPELLLFAFALIFTWLGFPRILDFIRDRQSSKRRETPEEVKALRERLENLESLICRLDAEMNTKLEQSLTSGRLM